MLRPDVTANHILALESGDYYIGMFFTLDSPTGRINVWSGSGTINHDDKEWMGTAGLVDFNITSDSLRFKIETTMITMNHLSPELMLVANDFANNDRLKGRSGTLYVGLINEYRKVIDNLIVLQELIVDSLRVEVNNNRNLIILNGVTGISNLTQPTRIVWTPEAQSKYLNDIDINSILGNSIPLPIEDIDIGFNAVAEIVNTSVSREVGIYDGEQNVPVQQTYLTGGPLGERIEP